MIKTSLDASESVAVLGKLVSARVDGGRSIQVALQTRCVSAVEAILRDTSRYSMDRTKS
jgi:hypothetical protein